MTEVRSAFEAGRGFLLDDFQQRALDSLDAGRSVLVAAPTGSGKTVVAEYAITRALAEGRKAFYTAPIKALSNQKYRDLVREHGAGSVGLLTGDNSINGDAPVVVMTTEVLRNMIYAKAPALSGLSYVVLDEVHYLQNPYRGAVWEEVIIHLPPEVHLVCLSATVSNAEDLADWIRGVRGETDPVIEEARPVELRHLYAVGDRSAQQAHLLATFVDGAAQRPNPEAARLDPPRGARRSGGQRRRRGRLFAPFRSDLVEILSAESMLPAIYFIFSRAGCNAAVRHCLRAGVSLTSSAERRRLIAIAEAHTASLSDEDLDALGYAAWLDGLEAGIAAHHAGMVPPMKEAVEEAFNAGLAKVVFATETLALGINMPARSVVIEKLSKFTGQKHEFLTPGEYTQLSGRAGRRGIDTLGYAVVCWSPFVRFDQVATLASRRTHALTSSFRPTYNMSVNLVRRYPPDRARHLLDLSFAQYSADRSSGKARRSNTLARQFDRVLGLLESRGYVDGWELTPAGEILARIYSETDLLVSESLRAGLLDGLGPSDLAAVVSCFTYERRGPEGDQPQPPRRWPSTATRSRARSVDRIWHDLNPAERDARLRVTRPPDPGFAAALHDWVSGEDLAGILEEEETTGGDFVRCTKQCIDLLRQIGDVAPDATTAATARSAAAAAFRGIISASSAVGDG